MSKRSPTDGARPKKVDSRVTPARGSRKSEGTSIAPDQRMSAGEAAKLLMVTKNTLYYWRDNGCPVLDGRKLTVSRTTRRSGRAGPEFYYRPEIERIAALRESATGIVRDSIGVWLVIHLAAARFGFCPDRIRKWIAAGHPVWGKPPRNKRFLAPTADGKRVERMVHVLEEDLDAIAPFESVRVVEPGRTSRGLTRKHIADRLGVDVRTVRNWEEACPHLDGQPLRGRLEMVFFAGKRRRVRVDALDQVEEIERSMGSARAEGPGTGLSREETAERLGISYTTVLRWEKGCPYLDGEPLLGGDRTVRVRGQERKVRFESLHLVEEIERRMRVWPLQPHVDDEGTWVRLRVARTRYGIPKDYLRPGKDYPALGRPIDSKRVRRPTARGAVRLVRVFLEEDLKAANSHRRNGNGTPTADDSVATQEAKRKVPEEETDLRPAAENGEASDGRRSPPPTEVPEAEGRTRPPTVADRGPDDTPGEGAVSTPPASKGWFHSADESAPQTHSHGPLCGTKTELGRCLGGKGGPNERTLEHKSRSGYVWTKRIHRTSFEAYFRLGDDYARAYHEKMALERERS